MGHKEVPKHPDGESILIRDEKGEIFNTVQRPTVIFDRDCGTVMKIGEWETMKTHYDKVQNEYRKYGFTDMADDTTLWELPKNQELVDKVFNNTGYVKSLYDKLQLRQKTGGEGHGDA